MRTKQILKEIKNDLDLINPNLRQWNQEYFKGHYNRYLDDFAIFQSAYQQGKILEVGSVPGHFTALLKKHNYPVVGLDPKPERISRFTKKYKLKIVKGDIEKRRLPFKDNSFGFIIFNETLEHLRINPLKALKEIRRVLSPKGKMMITTPNRYSLSRIVMFLLGKRLYNLYQEFEKIDSLGHSGHIVEYSTRELKQFLKEAGFKIVFVAYRQYGITEREHVRRFFEEKTNQTIAGLMTLPLLILDLIYKIRPSWKPMIMVICK